MSVRPRAKRSCATSSSRGRGVERGGEGALVVRKGSASYRLFRVSDPEPAIAFLRRRAVGHFGHRRSRAGSHGRPRQPKRGRSLCAKPRRSAPRPALPGRRAARRYPEGSRARRGGARGAPRRPSNSVAIGCARSSARRPSTSSKERVLRHGERVSAGKSRDLPRRRWGSRGSFTRSACSGALEAFLVDPRDRRLRSFLRHQRGRAARVHARERGRPGRGGAWLGRWARPGRSDPAGGDLRSELQRARSSGRARGVRAGPRWVGTPRGALSSLFRAVPRRYLRRRQAPGGTSSATSRGLGCGNRFDDLRRPLFVGATDQDTSQAVVFGEEGFRHVPVHKAVRASAALVPLLRARGDRRAATTSTARSRERRICASRCGQGATMVILVDPLVPVFSEAAGHVHSRGGVYTTMQGLKALINGRFDKAVRAIREMHPDVSFYLFRPYGDEMRILSGSPMKYFYRREGRGHRLSQHGREDPCVLRRPRARTLPATGSPSEIRSEGRRASRARLRASSPLGSRSGSESAAHAGLASAPRAVPHGSDVDAAADDDDDMVASIDSSVSRGCTPDALATGTERASRSRNAGT